MIHPHIFSILFFSQWYLLNILKSQYNAFKNTTDIHIPFRHYYARNTNNALYESIKRAIAIIHPYISTISLSYFTFRAARNKKNTKERKNQKQTNKL